MQPNHTDLPTSLGLLVLRICVAGFLTLALTGPGRFSVDALVGPRVRAWRMLGGC